MKRVEEIKKYQDLNIAGLEAELTVLEKTLIGDRLKVRAGKLDNTSIVEKTKKSIARIKTIINAKSLE